MANIFTLENFDDFSEKINIDELYEKKRQHDLNQLALYNKLLNRVHVRIKTTSRQNNDFFCWYLVPEVVIGVPKYDLGACSAYLLNKLKDNGFNVRYIHPNTLFISWLHWVPAYVRTELKNKTGIVVNEFGVKQEEIQKIDNDESGNNGTNGTNGTKLDGGSNKKKNYTPIQSYKPSGNLIYDNDLLNKIEEKIQK
jgi:hypothetical protein